MQAEYTKGTYEVFKTHKSNPMFMAAPLLVNMPLFMGLYWGVSTMCEGNLPSLLTEGLSWCPDLTKPDPYRVWNMAVPAALWVQVRPPSCVSRVLLKCASRLLWMRRAVLAIGATASMPVHDRAG